MIAITLRFFSEVDEEQNTAHDVLLPSPGVSMVSGVIVVLQELWQMQNLTIKIIFFREEEIYVSTHW